MITKLIPQAKPIKQKLPVCEVCGQKHFGSESNPTIDPQDRELVSVCTECFNTSKYAFWAYRRMQGEI